MPTRISRRDMLRTSAVAAGVWTLGSRRSPALSRSPNEKLNIAGIGVGGRGLANLQGVAGEQIVALCDVDDARAGGTYERFPQARRYADFRKMLEQMHDQLDAVVISTPDHTHAVPGVMAMELGLHCYCEKPLTHTVWEARRMAEAAKRNEVVTQMGNQIHAGANYRRVVELVQSGAIGSVAEVHVWLGADFDGPPGPREVSQPDAPAESQPVPETLDWDLWLGPAPYVPYHSAYVPFHWRYWWHFGNGNLGDFYCHYCDLAFWALDLRTPTTIRAEGSVHPESAARWTIAQQHFAARGDLPAVDLTWYNGGPYPEWAQERNIPAWRNAVLFIGSEGMLIADYRRRQLLPEARFADFQAPEPFLPDSIGHHREWVEACKTGAATTCDFDYTGPMTEAALLCNVALRTGEKITWDAENLTAIDCPAADDFIRREYRSGWEF